MGMRDYSHIRLTDSIINLTGKKISMYEESNGRIYRFEPSKEELPAAPICRKPFDDVVHYVVDHDKLEELMESGRELDDIAFVYGVGIGRHEVEISTLHWAKDPSIPVWLHHGVRNVSARHL